LIAKKPEVVNLRETEYGCSLWKDFRITKLESVNQQRRLIPTFLEIWQHAVH
jgi:hypothetical protein